jgi:catechol 2,3-dioxygenase-like lactoylglutathione lyase family enzyme
VQPGRLLAPLAERCQLIFGAPTTVTTHARWVPVRPSRLSFPKLWSSVAHPGQPVIKQTPAVVIGRTARHVRAGEAGTGDFGLVALIDGSFDDYLTHPAHEEFRSQRTRGRFASSVSIQFEVPAPINSTAEAGRSTRTDDVMTTRPMLDGVHHLKVPVTDLDESLTWWNKVLGAERQRQWDHFNREGKLYAYMCLLPGLEPPLELRLDPDAARSSAGFDPVSYAVKSASDLHDWARHLDEAGIDHSPVLRGFIGWLLVLFDPDGLPIHLYTRETHYWDEADADVDSPWLGKRPPA